MTDNLLKISRFDGTSMSIFRKYSRKFLAIGAIKGGFNSALTSRLDTSQGATNRDENITKNTTAWSYLILTLKKAPALLLDQVQNKDRHAAWTALNNQYMPRTISK